MALSSIQQRIKRQQEIAEKNREKARQAASLDSLAIKNSDSILQRERGAPLGKLTRAQKIAQQEDLRATTRLGGRTGKKTFQGAIPTEGGLTADERAAGITDTGQREMSGQEKLTRLKEAGLVDSSRFGGTTGISAGRAAIREESERRDAQIDRTINAPLPTKGEQETDSAFQLRRAKAEKDKAQALRDLAQRERDTARVGELLRKSRPTPSSGLEQPGPELPKVRDATDPDLEMNAAYEKARQDLEKERDAAIEDEVRKRMAGVTVTSEAARKQIEAQVRAQVTGRKNQLHSDALKQLEANQKADQKRFAQQEQGRVSKEIAARKKRAELAADPARRTEQFLIDQANEKVANGEAASFPEAFRDAKREFNAVEGDITLAEAVSTTTEGVRNGKIDINNAIGQVLSMDGVDNDFTQAQKVLKAAGLPDNAIKQQIKDYQVEVLGVDPQFVEESDSINELRRRKDSSLDGAADPDGLRMLSVFNDLKDDALQESYLRQVQASPTTNAIQKTLATLKLREGKETKKQEAAEFQFKNVGSQLVRVNPRTGEAVLAFGSPTNLFAGGTVNTTTGEGGAFEGLSPIQEASARKLAIDVYGKSAGKDATFLNPILNMMAQGQSVNEIRDRLEASDRSQAFTGDFQDAFGFLEVDLPSGQAAAARNNLDRLLERGDKAEARDFLLRTARSAAPAEEKKQVTGRDDALRSIDGIEKALNEYIEGGGELGLLKGNFEKFQQKVLKRTGDPELAKLANEIQVAIQAYRKSVSGAAFTESEGKEYENIFPSIDKSYELNKAKIDSIRTIFSRNQRSFYERSLGKDNYEKLFETAVPAKRDETASITAGVETAAPDIRTKSLSHSKLPGETFSNHGTFQMNRDTAVSFARSLGFASTDPESDEFVAEWNKRVNDNPEQFRGQEEEHIRITHFEPVSKTISELGVNVKSLALPLRQLMWDTSVQHGVGGARRIWTQAIRNSNENTTPKQFVDEITRIRLEVGRGVAPELQKGVAKRIKKVGQLTSQS